METSTTKAPLPPDRTAWWERRKACFPEARAILLPLLHDIQDHRGLVDGEAMQWAADFVGISPVEVYGVLTFYWMYDLEPRAKRRIAVCRNISCDLMGARRIVEALEDELGLECDRGGDGDWSLRTVECMGACTAAPMMDVNGRYFEELTPEKAREIVRAIREGREEVPEGPAEFAPVPANLARSWTEEPRKEEA